MGTFLRVAIIGDRTCSFFHGRFNTEEVGVRLTEIELRNPGFAIASKLRSEAKSKVAAALVFQRATRLWNTGTSGHIAMRALGPWAVLQYYAGHSSQTEERWLMCGVGSALGCMATKCVHLFSSFRWTKSPNLAPVLGV